MNKQLILKKYVFLSLQFIFLCISVSIRVTYNWNSFIELSRFSTVYFAVSFLMIIIIQKRLLTAINIIYILFILFQMGIPIAYSVNGEYMNGYVSLFNYSILIKAILYSLVSIQLFTISLLLFINNRYDDRQLFYNKKKKYFNFEAINDSKYMFSLARLIYFISSIVVIPLYTYVAYLTLKQGFSQEIRSIVAANGLFNLARAVYLPSFFLLLCYKSDNCHVIYAKSLFFYTSLCSLMSGNRTDGILWIIAYAFYSYQNNKHIDVKSKVKIFLVFVLLIITSVFIAQKRMGNDSLFSINNILSNVISEMGFNFTSICFVMMYLPVIHKSIATSYFISIISLFPNSLDIFGILHSIDNKLPIQLLWDLNHIKYNGLLDFGVGFSFIAESFYNFGNFGVILSPILAWIITKLFDRSWRLSNGWNKYLQIITFYVLLTFPRRAFNEILSSIEYSIFAIFFIAILFYKKNKSQKFLEK